MTRIFFVFVIASLFFSNTFSQKSEVWMFGPMLHFNFGDKQVHASFSLELAYWNYRHFPYSFDWGVEFERKKIRFYTEAQTGIGLAGVSSGPVFEIHADKGVRLGMQNSFWINYFLGADFRIRRIGGNSYFCPGTYVKLPLGPHGDTNGDNDRDWDWDD